MDLSKHFTIDQAAEYLDISDRAVSSLIRRGYLLHEEILGRKLVLRTSARARKRQKAANKLCKGGYRFHKSNGSNGL